MLGTHAEMCYPLQYEISFRNISFNDPVGSWSSNHTKLWTSSYILNETHCYDNGKKIIIGPEMKKFFNTALKYTTTIAFKSLRKGFKLATESGTIISSAVERTGRSQPLGASWLWSKDSKHAMCLCASSFASYVVVIVFSIIGGNILLAILLVYIRVNTLSLHQIVLYYVPENSSEIYFRYIFAVILQSKLRSIQGWARIQWQPNRHLDRVGTLSQILGQFEIDNFETKTIIFQREDISLKVPVFIQTKTYKLE